MNKQNNQLSPAFKKQAAKSIFAIVFFVVAYLVILCLALVLTTLCFWGAVGLISVTLSLITAAMSLGLVSLAVLILFFLVKFLFESHRSDRSHLIEINEDGEPELFAMIREIVSQVGTRFPKKIYLSAEVNAAVFYDAGFWAMFLPVKKNLQIGVGLINTVTRIELKAILSHEFGHFSQQSMKIGSYVYNVNQVIFNMLYNNESYNNLAAKWANTGWFISFAVVLALKINAGIQWVLRKLYNVVNKSYMGLSREMEFHADRIAAGVTGFEPMATALLRMSMSDNALNLAINFYNDESHAGTRSENIYKDQMAIIQYWTNENNYPARNGLPIVSLEEQNKFNKSKLIIRDQWSSHPPIAERISRMKNSGFTANGGPDAPANEMFVQIEQFQKQFTDKIFNPDDPEHHSKQLPVSEFIDAYKAQAQANTFPKLYNGYYDNKNPLPFDLNQTANPNSKTINDLFSDEKVDWVYTSLNMQNDIETLRNISTRQLPVKTFDYGEIRYKQKNAEELASQLQDELAVWQGKIKGNDAEIFLYFRRLEVERSRTERVENIYGDFFQFDQKYDSNYQIYTQMLHDLQFISETTPYDVIKEKLKQIKPTEDTLKKEITGLLNDEVLTNELTEPIKESLAKYISAPLEYFHGTTYDEGNLNVLYGALHNYAYLLTHKYFRMKRALLEYQEALTRL